MGVVRRSKGLLAFGICVVLMGGCSPFGLVDHQNPSTEMLDPKAIENQQGVLALYNNSVMTLATLMAGGEKTSSGLDGGNIVSFVRLVGHVSDELDYRMSTNNGTSAYPFLDVSTRNFDHDLANGNQKNFFQLLNNLRILAEETQSGFRVYGAPLPDAILAHAMAIEASALIITAELYCSGVPLSTLVYNGDVKLTRGYSTDEVYAFALAKLDSASSYAQADMRIAGLIDVLRIRVLLGMGEIQKAAEMASRVETSFQYQISYPKVYLQKSDMYYGKVTVASVPLSSTVDYAERISDRKGVNGLPYVSNQDPRVMLPALSDPWAPFVMASGVEARLAEAEAALQREDLSWLGILNQLRTSCATAETCPTPAPAGTGGVGGLGLLQDPGTAAARLNLLFEERAYWLFLRGFRQGDLRRRIRIYGGSVQELYPVGIPEIGNVQYGYMVSLPVPLSEQRYNPHYKGCQHNDA